MNPSGASRTRLAGRFSLALFWLAWCGTPARADTPVGAAPDGDWPTYGRDAGGTRFSPLDRITPSNVAQLQVAWIARTGISENSDPGNLEGTPLKIDATLYLCTSDAVIIALDAETGERRWSFDPQAHSTLAYRHCRGVAYFRAPEMKGVCAARVIGASADAALWAVDASTGVPCPEFGQNGRVDLAKGMGAFPKGFYYVSSPPTLVRDKIVVGGWVTDNQYVGEPSGVIRAFDARTGHFAWAWDLGRSGVHTEPAPGETYTKGTPNSWAPMSADEKLGLVFAPMGNATPDYLSAHRTPEMNRFASSVVAIDAETGEPRWSFQTTHNDVWDYDIASQPTLFDWQSPAGSVPALIQPTKTAQLYLLDRRSGAPLARVEERAVPQGPVAGEHLSATQPFSTGMPSLVGSALREADLWGITPFDQLWCRIRFHQMRYEGMYTPPSEAGSISYPGHFGGMNWGGASVDSERQIALINANRIANTTQLIPRSAADHMKFPVGPETTGWFAQAGTPFAAIALAFLSPIGMPCQQPPYGTLMAVDLRTRQILWQHPFGSARDSGPFGLASHIPLTMGVPNVGGSILLRSGLAIIAASQERSIRALDITTGRELWSARLPAGGQATPMTYLSAKSGRQFIVIAAGGSLSMSAKTGDYIVAFAIPQSAKRPGAPGS
jgi:quinoprotein glucose dehydrogenase